MEIIFGSSSNIPANEKLKNGYTLFEWVMRQKCVPSFWGRTLVGDNPLTREEVEFLKSKNCRIALVARDLTEVCVSGFDGKSDAECAIEAAKALGVPQGKNIAIFAEIKPDWSVNHNWMLSFAQMLENSGYLPGFIGNTDSSINFNFDRQCSHYIQALAEFGEIQTLYWATEPDLESRPEVWKPYCPSALEPEDIHFWTCGKTTMNQIKADDVYAQEELLERLWKGDYLNEQ